MDRFFQSNAGYILNDLHTWGWMVLLVGVMELAAAYSIFQGGEFGAGSGLWRPASTPCRH